jgi:GAF domain-containing protein
MFDASELDAIQPVADGSELVLDENGSMPPHVQPISIRGEEIGRLVVFPDDTGEAIDAEMLEILNVITEQLGARIDNIRLADQTQTALAETETQAQRLGQLNQMSNVLSQASSLENVYAAAVAETPNVLDADHVSLTLLTDSREKFDVAAGWGEEAQMSVNVPIPISDELPMWVAVQERRIVPGRIDDVIQSALFVPLYASGQVIGTLNIGSKRQHGFDSRDENLLRQIAALVSSTIENLRFLEKEQSRAQREQVLRQITQRVRSSADVETIMRTAVQEIGRTLGRKTYIYLGEDEA